MKRISLLLLFAMTAFVAVPAQNASYARQTRQTGVAVRDSKVCTVVEQMPLFPGGDAALRGFLRDNVIYPAKAKAEGITGRVVVGFVVETDGTITNAYVLRSVDPMLDAEALRVVRSMPRWIPGKQNGKCIRVKYQVPVTFRNDWQQTDAKLVRLAGVADNSGSTYNVVEQMPLFPGGDAALMGFLRDNVRYPAKAKAEGITGRVVVGFVVESDGTITNAYVLRSVDPMLDAEALRVVGSMPKWTPGKQNGKCVRVKYQVPVTFML